MFSLTVSISLVVEVSLDAGFLSLPFLQFQPASMSAKDFRTKIITSWLCSLTAGFSFKAVCQKWVPFLCLQNPLRHFQKRKKKNKNKMLSEKLYNKLHMKLFFTLVKTVGAGKTEALIVAAQNRRMVTRGAGKGICNGVSLSKPMRMSESRGDFCFS